MRTWENGDGRALRRVTLEFRGAQFVFIFAIFDYPVIFPADHCEGTMAMAISGEGGRENRKHRVSVTAARK